MCDLDGVSTRSLAGFGCESFVVVRYTGFMDGDCHQGIYPWVSTLVIGNLMSRRFCVGRSPSSGNSGSVRIYRRVIFGKQNW
jgi:hypothetical protein